MLNCRRHNMSVHHKMSLEPAKTTSSWIMVASVDFIGDHTRMATNSCCAECGEEGGVTLKICGACMLVKYCNASCQHKHWPKHKKDCKLRAAELRDEALFKDPPPKEDCQICFLPMPMKLICCMSLPPATITSVPIYDFAMANERLADTNMEAYYPCCGKSICVGCDYSFRESGNIEKCPFCNSNRNKTGGERVQEIMKRAEANDPTSTDLLANSYHHGLNGLQQNHAKAIELYTRAADLGSSMAHFNLGMLYHEGEGDLKKSKFHYGAAAMLGHEGARYNLGSLEAKYGNIDQAVKHWNIAASAGIFFAMHQLITGYGFGRISRKSINSTLIAYNNACADMRSEARDAFMFNN